MLTWDWTLLSVRNFGVLGWNSKTNFLWKCKTKWIEPLYECCIKVPSKFWEISCLSDIQNVLQNVQDQIICYFAGFMQGVSCNANVSSFSTKRGVYTDCDVSFLFVKISQQHGGITAIYISFHISTILYIFENICSFRYSSFSSYICTWDIKFLFILSR